MYYVLECLVGIIALAPSRTLGCEGLQWELAHAYPALL